MLEACHFVRFCGLVATVVCRVPERALVLQACMVSHQVHFQHCDVARKESSKILLRTVNTDPDYKPSNSYIAANVSLY